jgi:hypothetical protein
VRRMSGAPDEDIVQFFAKGMLLNVVAALELPDRFVPIAAGTEAASPPAASGAVPASPAAPSASAPAPRS